MTPQERRRRSQITKLVAGYPFLRGTLVERERVCGNPNCRCAKGQKHPGLYLMSSKNGKTRQLYVPMNLQDTVQQWIDYHSEIRDLMEQVSDIHWTRVRERKL